MNTVYINKKTLEALPKAGAGAKIDSGEWLIMSQTKSGDILILFVDVSAPPAPPPTFGPTWGLQMGD